MVLANNKHHRRLSGAEAELAFCDTGFDSAQPTVYSTYNHKKNRKDNLRIVSLHLCYSGNWIECHENKINKIQNIVKSIIAQPQLVCYSGNCIECHENKINKLQNIVKSIIAQPQLVCYSKNGISQLQTLP